MKLKVSRMDFEKKESAHPYFVNSSFTEKEETTPVITATIEDIEPGDDLMHLLAGQLALDPYIHFGPAIVICGHCGQWAARKTACRYCGAPVA